MTDSIEFEVEIAQATENVAEVCATYELESEVVQSIEIPEVI